VENGLSITQLAEKYGIGKRHFERWRRVIACLGVRKWVYGLLWKRFESQTPQKFPYFQNSAFRG